MTSYVVAKEGEIPVGGRKLVNVGNRSVGVFNFDGEYFAFHNRCPHQGGPLCEGPILGFVRSPLPGEYRRVGNRKLLQCPWHGWEFDLTTGESWFDPVRTRVRRYSVTVETGRSLTEEAEELHRGPYSAEVYPVSVENDYIVVHLRNYR